MMMINDHSAEEKLLHLIKKKKKDKIEHRPETDHGRSDKEIQANKTLIGAVSDRRFEGLYGLMNLKTIRSVNTLLFVVLICVILYFLADIFIASPKKIEISYRGAGVPKKEAVILAHEVKPYSFYSQALDNKQAFRPIERTSEKRTLPGIPMEELMSSLSLLGIVSGDKPQAIIEEKNSKKSFFIKEGQTISGIRLKKIEDGSATVVYKGEEFTLTM